MPRERPTLSPLSIPDPTIPSQRPNKDPERDITALPPMHYPETDPWAPARRPRTDTLDDIPTPTDHPAPSHSQDPAVTMVEQATEPASSNTATPPRKPIRQSRFPIKAQTTPSIQQSSNHLNATTTNKPTNNGFQDVELGAMNHSDDIESAKIAAQYKGIQGGWRSMKWKLISSAVFAVVVTVAVVVVALEVPKKDPGEFGKV